MSTVKSQVTIAQTLAMWSHGLRYQDIPSEVVHAAKRSVIDTIGVAIAGSVNPRSLLLSEHVKKQYKNGDCSVLGCTSTGALGAAFLNSYHAHILDFDDTSYAGIVHGSIIALPAVLAASNLRTCSGKEFLKAFVVAVETIYTFGQSLSESHYHTGWWATATCGVIGAAAGSAKALSLSEQQTTMAIGFAASQAAGMCAILGTDAKPIMAGRAAQTGLESALLAAQNLTSPLGVFEEPFGFVNLMNENRFDKHVLSELGRVWRLIEPGILFKTYPVCSAAHAAIEAMSHIIQSQKLNRDEVRAVYCDVPLLVAKCLKYPHPQTIREAQFSMPFALGCVLTFGKFGLDELTEISLQQKTLQKAMAKISMTEADDLNQPKIKDSFPECARVTVTVEGGASYTHFIGAPKGMPDNLLSDQELSKKFRTCLAFANWPETQVESALDMLWKLDTLQSLSELLCLLSQKTP